MSHNKPFANMKKHAFNKKVNRMQQASKRACTLINGVCHTLNCSFIHPNKQTSQPVSVTPISAARTEPELVDIGRKSLRGVDIRPAWMTNPHLYGDSTGATWSAKEVIPANKRKDISPQSKISMYDIDQGSDISFDARNSLRSADRRPDIFDTAPSTEFCEQQGIIKLQAALEERGMKRVAEPKWGNKNQINQITQAAAKRLFEHVTWQQTTAAKRSFARKELSPCFVDLLKVSDEYAVDNKRLMSSRPVSDYQAAVEEHTAKCTVSDDGNHRSNVLPAWMTQTEGVDEVLAAVEHTNVASANTGYESDSSNDTDYGGEDIFDTFIVKKTVVPKKEEIDSVLTFLSSVAASIDESKLKLSESPIQPQSQSMRSQYWDDYSTETQIESIHDKRSDPVTTRQVPFTHGKTFTSSAASRPSGRDNRGPSPRGTRAQVGPSDEQRPVLSEQNLRYSTSMGPAKKRGRNYYDEKFDIFSDMLDGVTER